MRTNNQMIRYPIGTQKFYPLILEKYTNEGEGRE